MRPSAGGGQTDFQGPRRPDPAAIAVPEGYRVELFATGLTFPTDIAFDDENRPHVVESGYSYGEVFATPRLLRIEPDGTFTEIAAGASGREGNGPWNGLAWHDGAFYVAEGGVMQGGRILRISPEGEITAIIEDLPSMGDHHTNGPAIGPDGKIYFAVGTATNSGVVGLDNHEFGWLERFPEFHDVPARDITLAGINYVTPNPLAGEGQEREVSTGAFVPFGTPTQPGQVIEGRLPATGCIMRIDPDGGDVELVAWGLRNVFGLAFTPEGELYATENSFDRRGSRPVFGAGDLLWRIDLQNLGTWHGWPDFHAGRPLSLEDRFTGPDHDPPGMLLAEHPNDPPRPVARLAVHASANHLDFSRSEGFGHVGEAFIAQFGDMAPKVGRVMGAVGFNVIRVDTESGVVRAFAVNRGDQSGPASLLGHGGLERPIAARFGPDGEALYIVDFGVLTVGESVVPRQGTGVIWRITRADAPPAQSRTATAGEVRP